MFVIGTAGHIDHGKSVLVHALTGIDPDRLREEKERGMTIDLGFAWLTLPSGREVGIVDVPGHERFIKNMLAGVGGIDLAVLVVAANEGVMPQTREHVAILDLLEVQSGIVVVTKKDLVDDELLSLVNMEVEELLSTTTLSTAPIVSVSAMTGDGMDQLIEKIDALLDDAIPREDKGRPRLLIDRSFTIVGSGSVVTGTLVDGSLSVGQDVEVVPSGLKTRLRGLQTHKTKIETASPGSRVAANLVGLSAWQLNRGDVLTVPGWLQPTTRVDTKLRILASTKRPFKHSATISFHSGAAEVIGKGHLLEAEEIRPGEQGMVQFTFEDPISVLKGDHFIIRSPSDTLGGGTVVTAHTSRHRRFREGVLQNLKTIDEGNREEALSALLAMKQPMGFDTLLVEGNISDDDARQALEKLIERGDAVEVGQGDRRQFVTRSWWDELVGKAAASVESYHQKFPTRSGMPKGELSSKLGLPPQSPALEKLIQSGVLVEEGASVRTPSHSVELTQEQQSKADAFIDALNSNPYSPPGDLTLEADLMTMLIKEGKVVKVAEGVIFSQKAYDEMVSKIMAYGKERGKITAAEVRDLLGTSRKYVVALLEFMDSKKLTRRVGDERVVRQSE